MSVPVVAVLPAPAVPDRTMASRTPFWHARSFTRPTTLSDPSDLTWPDGVSEEKAQPPLFI